MARVQIDSKAEPGRRQTILQDLSSAQPPSPAQSKHMRDEALSLLSAGTETTKWALSVGCFHLLDNPEMATRLKKELETLPGPILQVGFRELEALPYLTAVVLECKFIRSTDCR